MELGAVGCSVLSALRRLIAITATSAPRAAPAIPQGKPARHPAAWTPTAAPHLWQKRPPGESCAPQAWHVIGVGNVTTADGLAGGVKAGSVGPMAATEYGKHMGELKRGEQRWDVYLEGQPDTTLGAVRGRIHFVSGQQHKMTGWIFLEWQERDIQERFGEFSAVELLHFVESL